MSILYDDVMTNIEILNAISDGTIANEEFTHTTEWIAKYSGDLKITAIPKGKNYSIFRNGYNRIERVHYYPVGNVHGIYVEPETPGQIVMESLKMSVCFSSYGVRRHKTVHVEKNDRIKIKNRDNNNGYIDSPSLYINNNLAIEYLGGYSKNSYKYSIKPIKYINDSSYPSHSTELKVNETYIFYTTDVLDGQEPGDCGSYGKFTFKVLEINQSDFLIDIKDKYPDGREFPHGLVKFEYNLGKIEKKNLDVI